MIYSCIDISLYTYIYIYIYIRHRAPARRCDLRSDYCPLAGSLLQDWDLSWDASERTLLGPPKNRHRWRQVSSPPPLEAYLTSQTAFRHLFLFLVFCHFFQCLFQDAPRRLQDSPRGLQNGPRPAKTVFWSQHGPMLAPTWTHVGTKIAFRRYLMLKQPES